jgi:hypothetical protein
VNPIGISKMPRSLGVRNGSHLYSETPAVARFHRQLFAQVSEFLVQCSKLQTTSRPASVKLLADRNVVASTDAVSNVSDSQTIEARRRWSTMIHALHPASPVGSAAAQLGPIGAFWATASRAETIPSAPHTFATPAPRPGPAFVALERDVDAKSERCHGGKGDQKRPPKPSRWTEDQTDNDETDFDRDEEVESLAPVERAEPRRRRARRHAEESM